jgi:hypothetical protein
MEMKSKYQLRILMDSRKNSKNPRNIDLLLKRIQDVEEGKNLIIFSPEEFDKLTQIKNILAK